MSPASFLTTIQQSHHGRADFRLRVADGVRTTMPNAKIFLHMPSGMWPIKNTDTSRARRTCSSQSQIVAGRGQVVSTGLRTSLPNQRVIVAALADDGGPL
jgi:hypothetical protein